jgi:uncharacterized membrane protein YtjA (UPF0391 family)
MPVFIRRLTAAGPRAWIVLALGLGAAILMVATEFSTIQSVRIGDSTCGAAEERLRDVCSTSGGDQHNYALLVLGLFTALLAFGAAVGRSRPAAFALFGVGVVVLLIALLLDAPTFDDRRGLEVYYGESGTRGERGGAFTLELIAAGLAFAAAGVALWWDRVRLPALRLPRRRRSAAASEDAPTEPADSKA